MRLPSFVSAATALLGVFYLLSGVGKALAIGQFAATIGTYGLPRLAWLAPGLIALEMGLGAALLLQVQPRRMALLSGALLAVFTALFAYGYLARGVRDCGCFGAIDALALPPALSFARNFLLLALSAVLYRRAPQPTRNHPAAAGPLRTRLVLAVTLVALLGAGVAYAQRPAEPKIGVVRGQALRGSLLAPYVPALGDSTYLVFVFSPGCPHCWHATPTVASYQGQGVVDRVIALYAPGDSADTGRYRRQMNPPFALHPIAATALRAIAPRVPLAVLVRRGAVARVFVPPFPSADSLRALLSTP